MLYELKHPVAAWKYTGQNLSVIRNQFAAHLLKTEFDPKKLVFMENTSGSFLVYFMSEIKSVSRNEYLVFWPWGELSVYSESAFLARLTSKTV